MKNNELRAVLWDMDGVVADTARQHFQSWQFAFGKHGVKFSEGEFKSVFGQRNDIIIRKIMGAGVNPAMIEKVARDKEEFFRAAVKKDLKPFPGVIKLLITIKDNGIRAAIGSSAPLENIRAVLSGLGIEDYFQALVYGLEVQEGKPSPQVFQLAARKLGAQPGNCIVIEDAVAGVRAAKSGGMHCIAVTNTHPAATLAEADVVVDSLERIGLNQLNMLFSQKLK
jgi:beta-phosphoglucomutase family hydrolase